MRGLYFLPFKHSHSPSTLNSLNPKRVMPMLLLLSSFSVNV